MKTANEKGTSIETKAASGRRRHSLLLVRRRLGLEGVDTADEAVGQRGAVQRAARVLAVAAAQRGLGVDAERAQSVLPDAALKLRQLRVQLRRDVAAPRLLLPHRLVQARLVEAQHVLVLNRLPPK